MQKSLYQTADAVDSIRQRMQETLSDSGCRKLLFRQWMQETFYQTADAGDSIRQRMQEILYQTAEAGDSIRQRMH